MFVVTSIFGKIGSSFRLNVLTDDNDTVTKWPRVIIDKENKMRSLLVHTRYKGHNYAKKYFHNITYL